MNNCLSSEMKQLRKLHRKESLKAEKNNQPGKEFQPVNSVYRAVPLNGTTKPYECKSFCEFVI